MEDAELAKLTVPELEEFKARVESAIRAKIRAKAEARQAQAMRIVQPQAQAPSPKLDLEGERDRWLAARKRAI